MTDRPDTNPLGELVSFPADWRGDFSRAIEAVKAIDLGELASFLEQVETIGENIGRDQLTRSARTAAAGTRALEASVQIVAGELDMILREVSALEKVVGRGV